MPDNQSVNQDMFNVWIENWPGMLQAQVWVQSPGLADNLCVSLSSMHALRLIPWTEQEGSTVFSIICDH